MLEFQRVKDNETGHEFSTRRPNPKKVTILDKPATLSDGRPLPAKPNTSKGGKTPAKKVHPDAAAKVESE